MDDYFTSDNIKPQKNNSIKLITIIVILIIFIGVIAWFLITSYYSVARATKLYDEAENFMYEANYERARDKITDSVKLINKNLLASKELKNDIKRLDFKIKGFEFLEQAKLDLSNNNVNSATYNMQQALGYNFVDSDIKEKEKDFINELNEANYRQTNKSRNEELLTKLMNNFSITSTYADYKKNKSIGKYGICGIAEYVDIYEDNYGKYYKIMLTTYDNNVENYFVELPWGQKLLDLIKQNGKIEVALIVSPYYVGYGYHVWSYQYYDKRIIPNVIFK